jgi:metal-responsive CopG/Arc/MetJ family transcriptional regulator
MRTQARTIPVARVTLTLPSKLWEDVKRLVPAGRRSQLVAEALEAEVKRHQQQSHLESIRQFQDYLFRKYGEMPSCVDDITQIREERD